MDKGHIMCSQSVSQDHGLAEQRKQSVPNQSALFNQISTSFSHVIQHFSGPGVCRKEWERPETEDALSFFFQEAGWLAGIKESEWLQCRDAKSSKGVFPENFTRHLEQLFSQAQNVA